jgi:hypothetical protein
MDTLREARERAELAAFDRELRGARRFRISAGPRLCACGRTIGPRRATRCASIFAPSCFWPSILAIRHSCVRRVTSHHREVYNTRSKTLRRPKDNDGQRILPLTGVHDLLI